VPERKDRIAEPAVEAAGAYAGPPVLPLNAQTVVLSGEPAIVFIQPLTVSLVAGSGELHSADVIETVVLTFGGRPLRLPTDFPGGPAEGWHGELDAATSAARIWQPDGRLFYDGTAPIGPAWRRRFAAGARSTGRAGQRGEVVLVTGPFASPTDIEPVVLAGRASWLRISLLLT
jgi:hypothetical protein